MFGWLIEIRPIFQTIYNKLVWRSKWREKLKNKSQDLGQKMVPV